MADDPLTRLYQTYSAYIYVRCVRLLGDHAAAQDATQETFMRVYRHLHKAPDAAQALPWIYRIATNYCLNEIRDRRLRPQAQEVPELVADDLGAVLSDRDLVARLIRRCPSKLRVPAWLHYVDGLSQGEVANVLGISRRTVVSRLSAFVDDAQKRLVRRPA